MYVQSSEEELLKAARKEDTENQETATSFKQEEGLKTPRNGTKNHCTDNLQERLNTRVMTKHGPGGPTRKLRLGDQN